jgi:DNA-binding transcriptional MerR regulator
MQKSVNTDQTFTTGKAARIAGVSHRTVDYWAKMGIVVPSITDTAGAGSTRLYDFGDLIALRAARELRDAGISMKAMQSVVAKLKEHGWNRPLTETRVIAIGSEVYVVRGAKKLEAILRKQGQSAFAFMLDLERTEQSVREEMKRAA